MTDYARVISAQLFVDWNFDDIYTDESTRLIEASGQLKLTPPESTIFSPRGTADRCTITLDNRDGRYSSLLTTGALYADLSGGGAYQAPMYLQISIDNSVSFDRVFTGVIKIPLERAPTPSQAATVVLDCRSRDETILSKRLNTTQAAFAAWLDSPPTEDEIMASILQSAGLVAGDYTLDAGLFRIPYAWLDNESTLETCWQLASACGGRFYCDPDGEFRYENYTHWLVSPHDSSIATLARNVYTGIQPHYEDRELYETISVQIQPRSIAVQDTIWEAHTTYIVPANTTGANYVTVVAELSHPAYVLNAPTYSAVTSGGSSLSANVTCTPTNYAQRVVMQFQNSHTTQAALITGLALTRRLVQADENITQEMTSADSFWTGRTGRSRNLTGNRWLQSKAQADAVTEFLRDRHETPRLFFTVTNYWGDPVRRLGDRLTLNDDQIMSASADAFVIGIDWRYGGGRFRQSLECIDATGLYEFATTPGYFRIGTDALGTSNRVVFY